jgi:hypothetical protein
MKVGMTALAERTLTHGMAFTPTRDSRPKPQVSYLMWMPLMARLITKRWISDVPSKIV